MLDKIREKREFSQLPEIDIETAYSHFETRQASEDEKIKLAREFLRKIFSAFISKKLLSLKDKSPDWILRKHISTRERLPYYEKIYNKIFGDLKKVSVVDFGAGINGFSFEKMNFSKRKINYVAVESVGQLVELMNYFFEKEKLKARAIHLSLLEKEEVKKLIKKMAKPRIVFLFKVIDALESLKPNYSKELISEIAPLADKIVVSFPTRSLGSREKFKVKRNWIVNFIKEKFNILDDFELGGERYISFSK